MAGEKGMQYDKKSFTVMGDTVDTTAGLTAEEAEEQARKVLEESKRIEQELAEQRRAEGKKSVTIIPFGDRILCKRRAIGKTLGSGILVAADETSERPTDLADVVYVPDMTFCDNSLINNAEMIISTLTTKASNGDSDALNTLLEFNKFLKLKSIKKGDAVMIGKYTGVDFHDNRSMQQLTLLSAEDVIGLVLEAK